MKLTASLLLSLSLKTLGQSVATIGGGNPTTVSWINFEKTIDENDQTVISDEPEIQPQQVDGPMQQNIDQGEIEEFRKKNVGIYDPNMYPYGPLHGDYRAPGADDAVSDLISLPSTFPFFGGSTDNVRASTNGMIILSNSQIFASSPEAFPPVSISEPIIVGFWNDIWTKKHGKIYWRVEETNTTLLDEMRSDIIAGYPELYLMGDIIYAFILSFWSVSYWGATKISAQGPNGETNTFQTLICTTGTYSFMINNYQQLRWSKAREAKNHAVAGYSLGNDAYAMIDGSLTSDCKDWSNESTNSDMGGRHIYRLDDVPPPTTTVAPDTTTQIPEGIDPETDPPLTNPALPVDTVIAENIWPSNDNTLGGGIFKYKPADDVGNGTCSIMFPYPVAWFHVFDAHIRADSVSVPTMWNLVAANTVFEPNPESGAFNFVIEFERGFEFTADDITMDCQPADDFEFAVYSFPQNGLEEQGRSNIRKKDVKWDTAATYALAFPQPVANFTLDDGRITAATADNQSFLLSTIPDTIQEVWFQFDYINYFGSNEVMVKQVE